MMGRILVKCKTKAICSICNNTIEKGSYLVLIEPTDTEDWSFQCNNTELHRKLLPKLLPLEKDFYKNS